jgi:hypothetical protein
MGKTFGVHDQLPSNHFVENTIDSFREAFNRGAQMVKFYLYRREKNNNSYLKLHENNR